MVEVPDGLAEIGIVLLSGIIGWLARSVTDLRSRVAVTEARQADGGNAIKRLEAKVDRLTAMLERHIGRSANILGGEGAH